MVAHFRASVRQRRLKTNPYALVTVFHPHAPRRPRRRGGRLAPPAAARGLYPTTRLGYLLAAAAGLACRAARDESPARRDGSHRRAGVLPARPPPRRGLEGVRPLGGDGPDDVPPEGSEGRRHVPRHDARGGLHL